MHDPRREVQDDRGDRGAPKINHYLAMKPSEIHVGRTYCNRGAGRTTRTVLEISKELPAPWFSMSPRPDEPVVRFRQPGQEKDQFLYLQSFASWAGREVS